MKIRPIHLLACSALLLPLFAVGCGGGDKKPARKSGSADQTFTKFEVDPATAGSIQGTVKFTGGEVKRQKLKMSADPFCDQQHPDGALARNVVVNDNQTLRWVFVYVKEGLEGKMFPTPDTAVELDQKGCQYDPHVFGVQTDQTINIKNSDQTLHNIHAKPQKNKEFNMAQPMAGMVNEASFSVSEVMVPIKCDVHPWMATYAGVLDHPYYAVTDSSGSFSIANLPPGDYTIEAWHEKFGPQTQKVSVGEKETKAIEFSYSGE